jgi:hypothetical protein
MLSDCPLRESANAPCSLNCARTSPTVASRNRRYRDERHDFAPACRQIDDALQEPRSSP